MANTTGKKYGGRKKGTVNKATQTVKEVISQLLEDNSDKAMDEMKTLTGKAFIDAYAKLAAFVVPKQSEVQVTQAEPFVIEHRGDSSKLKPIG